MSRVDPPHPPLRPPPGPEHPPNPFWKWLALTVGSVLVLGAVLAAFGVGQDKSDSTAPATSPAAPAGDRSPATTTTTTPTAPTTTPPATTPTTAEPAAAPATTTTQPQSAPTPRDRLLKQVESQSRDLCASVSLAKLKATYGGTESFSTARAYAQQSYRPGLALNAEKGCITGMQDRGFK